MFEPNTHRVLRIFINRSWEVIHQRLIILIRIINWCYKLVFTFIFLLFIYLFLNQKVFAIDQLIDKSQKIKIKINWTSNNWSDQKVLWVMPKSILAIILRITIIALANHFKYTSDETDLIGVTSIYSVASFKYDYKWQLGPHQTKNTVHKNSW